MNWRMLAFLCLPILIGVYLIDGGAFYGRIWEMFAVGLVQTIDAITDFTRIRDWLW